MRKFVMGVLSAIALILLAGSMTGDGHRDPEAVRVDCEVRVSYPSPSFGTKCYFDDVMTGYDGDRIYCSRLEVYCRE